MAQRRMFSVKIIETDAFMSMPLSAQALYFHLGMRADDDGFVSNARTIQRLVGASDDDLRLLLMKRFLLTFDSGVIVIKHWRINNYVRGDRYTPTLYQEEKRQLYVKKNGVYTDHPILPPAPVEADKLPEESPADYMTDEAGIPSDIPMVAKWETQDRLGKDRLGKESIGKDKNNGDVDGNYARVCAESEVFEYLRSRNMEPSDYFGVNEGVINEAAALTQAIFSRFTNREPTKADVANVFFACFDSNRSDETGEYFATLVKERKDLLMYAFEQAMNAGEPGNWQYIHGVLGRLYQRGISDLSSAEEYDYERKNWRF